jgi:8-oxo-dGTP pyrophosphatase MutT (NUDIX family)
MTGTVATPQPAATALLLKPAETGIAVLMQRRRASLSFMGGMWVFPGGRHEPGDRATPVLARVRDPGATLPTLRDAAGNALTRELTVGLYATACRETFEECGILLAATAAGEPVFTTRERSADEWREAVIERPEAFAELLEREDLYLDTRRLVYWSHWITPAAEKRRFDTRFFAIAVPGQVTVAGHDRESTEQRWMRPAAALTRIFAGELAAAPPTIFMLEHLADCQPFGADVEALLEAERGREVPPIRPVLTKTADGFEVRMPWDAEYDAGSVEPLARPASYPEHYRRRASRMPLNPTYAARAT